MAICIQIRSIYVISLFLFLICPKTHAETNLNAQKISVTSTLLNGYDLHHPEISPNDSLIAFSVSKKGTWQKCTIWIQEIASGKVWQVTDEDSTMGIGDVLVRWSPDMKYLAFASDRNGESHLYTHDLSKLGIKRLTNSPTNKNTWQNRVAWKLDEHKILAVLNKENGDNIFSIDVNSLEHTQLSNFTGKNLESLDLSKDGRTLLYTKSQGSQIETFDIHSGVTQDIEVNITGIGYPTWSPNGEWIGFQSYASGNWGTYILNRTGGDPVSVGPENRHSQVPSWSSDGQSIIYHAYYNALFDLTVKDLNSEKEVVLFDNIQPTSVGWWWGSWSPDSKKIIAIDRPKDSSIGRLNVIDVESTSVTHVADVPLIKWSAVYQVPVWLDDNTGFFSILSRNGETELALISLPSFQITTLTSTAEPKHSVAISPDQELIAFVSGEIGEEDIWIYDRVLGDAYKLTQSTGQKTMLTISPSGEQLLYLKTANNFFDSKLIIADIESGEIKHTIDLSKTSGQDRFEYHPQWIDEENIAFTTGYDDFRHRIWLRKSLLNKKEDLIVFNKDGSIAQPQLLNNQSLLLYQIPWPLGSAVIHNIKTGEYRILIDRDLYTPLISPDGQSIAFINAKNNIEATSIWRENVAHIVSQNRLP